jgi:hypothetical protein
MIALACAAVVAPAAGAAAGTVLTFSELPADTPVNGLTIQGVRLTYTGPSPDDAFYNSAIFLVGPADAANLSGSVLEGSSDGTLTIDFLEPTNHLRFAALLSTFDPLDPGLAVELFDAALVSLGSSPLAMSQQVAGTGFSEGVFEFNGGKVLLGRAVIDFADAPGRFAVDNLRAELVPEPGSLTTAGIGAVALAGIGLRRRHRARG